MTAPLGSAMADTREFELGQILSVTGNKIVTEKGISGVYEILNFMTADTLFTHQLPRALKACKPWLLEQHPGLAGLDDSGVNRENWHEWIATMMAKHGGSLPVSPIPAGEWEHMDPIEEMASMVGPERVIVVDPTP